ncbi:DUF302 domain-containing protein [Pararhizobium haloflavum]|uniref:DUF302 domain-containing protein n=1 Tax=Pararhizobium haloflavum TaxID=2037914 RepID=UPI001FDFA94B|nr:DUF302 domain-containing protein [Pararhizobium haloflavum]
MQTRTAIAAIALAAMAWHHAAAQEDGDLYTVMSDLPYEDVALALSDAIVNRGYVVDHEGDVAGMLARTAEEVGADDTIYTDAQFFQFCSAVVSRDMMSADPANIAYCPYIVFVYAPADESETVTVGYRKLPGGGGRDEANDMLTEIVDEAAEGF